MTVKEANEYYKQNAKCVKEILSGLRRRTECFSHPCKDCLWDLTKEREAKDMAIRSLEAWEKVVDAINNLEEHDYCQSEGANIPPMIDKEDVLNIINMNLSEV